MRWGVGWGGFRLGGVEGGRGRGGGEVYRAPFPAPPLRVRQRARRRPDGPPARSPNASIPDLQTPVEAPTTVAILGRFGLVVALMWRGATRVSRVVVLVLTALTAALMLTRPPTRRPTPAPLPLSTGAWASTTQRALAPAPPHERDAPPPFGMAAGERAPRLRPERAPVRERSPVGEGRGGWRAEGT